MLFQSKSRGGLRAVGNVLTKRGDWIGSGGVFAHNDDDESPDPTPSPIHSLDLTTAPSASNAFDDYGLATSRTVTDYNGRIVEIPANAVPMGGLRHVRNLLQAANDFENAAWVASMSGTGTLPIITPAFTTHTVGGSLVDVTRVQFDCGAGTGSSDFSIVQQIVSSDNPLNYVPCGSIYCKLNAGTSADMYLRVHATDMSSSVAITDEWRRVSVAGVLTGSYNVLTFGLRGTATAGTQTLDVLVCCATSQDITHRADLSTAPDEYVSTDDDYGTGVNGFRYFDTALANTVASNVVTEGTGASVEGWLDYQPEATNLQINSNDFTARTKSASGAGSVFPTVTPGYADGPLGESTATRVQLNRGTSADGYSVILDFNLPVVNATNYTHSIYARTLSGTADIALYNSSNEFDPTNATVHTLTTTWQRIAHAEQSTGAGTAGTGIGLLGSNYCICDQTADILVCAQQFEVGTVPTAYIPTTIGSASRPAMSPAPTISGLVGTEDARLTVKGLAADLVTPDPTDTTERTLDIDNTDGEFDTLPLPIKVLRIDVYNDGERPA